MSENITVLDICCFHGTDIEEVHIHENVHSIGCCAFQYCKWLRKVTFATGSKLKEIQEGTFCKCDIVSIDLPKELEKIGEWAFYDCSNLKCISLPKNIEEIP